MNAIKQFFQDQKDQFFRMPLGGKIASTIIWLFSLTVILLVLWFLISAPLLVSSISICVGAVVWAFAYAMIYWTD